MCCTVTRSDLVVVLLLAAAVALVLMAPLAMRYRRSILVAWALVPVWVALGFGAVLATTRARGDSVFVIGLVITLFQPLWLIAVAVGVGFGAAIRKLRGRGRA